MQYDERPLQHGLSIRYVWSLRSHKHLWMSGCVFGPPLPLHDLNFTAPGPHPSAQSKNTEATSLAAPPSPSLVILHPSLPAHSSLSPCSCCVCRAAFPGRSAMLAPCFPRARLSPVQCPISENETWESGYRNAPFPPDSLSITMMESYDDRFYCICRIFELTLGITHCSCAARLSR